MHSQQGCTALHWAFKKGRVDAAKLLLVRGADPLAKDEVSITLHIGRYMLFKPSRRIPQEGRTPRDVCSDPDMLQLLDAPSNSLLSSVSSPSVSHS